MVKKLPPDGPNGASHLPAKKAPSEKKKIASRTDIPIQYVIPNEQKAIYTNHFAVQHENGIYHLMFFQINPPLLSGSQSEKADALRAVSSLDAIQTARIVVSGQLLPKIIDALVENLQTQTAREKGEIEIIDVSSETPQKPTK